MAPTPTAADTDVATPSREIVVAPTPGTAPALRQDSDAELRPWQEPFDGAGDLEPWEEIPVRLSPTDRAGAALDGSWRVAVTSLFAGSGTTTVTAGLGLVLADVRGEDVVAVDASLARDLVSKGGPADQSLAADAVPATFGISLTRRLGAQPATTISGLARHRTDPFPPADMVMLVTGTESPRETAALDVVAARVADLRNDRRQPGALVATDDLVTPTALRAALRLLSEGYPLVLLDAPGDSPLTPTVLRGADVVVLVVLATPTDLDAAAADLRDPDGIAARLGEPPPPVIAVVVSARRGRWSPQTRAAAARLSRRVDGLIRLPYDVRLDNDTGAPTPIGRLRRRSRRAFLGLAAVLVDALVDEADTLAASDGDGEQQANAEETETSGWDLEKGSGVSSDHLRSTSPIGDAPDRPGGNPPARKDP